MAPHVILFILLTLAPAVLSANERSVTSKITEARVFLGGAQLTRTASTTVPAGASTIIFTGLTQELDPRSIQVSGKGSFSILSVNHRMNHLAESPRKKEVEEIQARVKKLEKEHALEKAMQDVWVNEEHLLNKNSEIRSQQNGITAAQLAAVNDYVRERLRVTKSNYLAQQEKLAAINEELAKLRQQLQQLQAQTPGPTSEIVVEVSSTTEVNASFSLNYFTSLATWAPAYDLRATSTDKPIELVMKALVTNSTGEDWSRVALSLNSGDPRRTGTMPALNPWTLYSHRPVFMNQAARAAAPAMQMDKAEESMARGRKDMEDARVVMETTLNVRTTTLEYSIETPFTIPGNGKVHTVAVSSHSIPATYKHYVTPKLDRDAFLYARTTGWEDLGLLPGNANIFFEGTYVGQSHLQLDLPNDTLDISLGRDKGVVVERVRRKSSDQKGVLGNRRTVTIGWDITVRNTKASAIDLEVRDQFPLSPQSEVEVKLEDRGGAQVDEQRGLLTWNINLQPKASRKLGFSYVVKHPRDMPVILE
jgi:uncharacterized protein (TIGR02231 family)